MKDKQRRLQEESYDTFCELHSHPIDMIFSLYEDKYWFWKFLTQFFER